MRIVIAGAGAVGLNLARDLSEDKHDICIIEADAALIRAVQEKVDVQAVSGSCTDVEVLQSAHVDQADIFVAVTNSDEVNIVACVLAHALQAKRRIARVRNPHLSGKEPLVDKREFHINRIVNPDTIAAETAVRLIKSPGLRFRADFAEGEVLLRAYRLREADELHDWPLSDLAQRFPDRPFLVAAVERSGEFTVPRGRDVLKVGDVVYLLMLKGSEDRFKDLIRPEDAEPGRIVVYGATSIGMKVLRRLESVPQRVLVDESRARAERAAEALPGVLVLHGWVSSDEIGREVDFAATDCFVAAGEDDRMNLVAALYAKQRGAERTMVLAREPDIVPLLQALQFDAVINARLLAVSEISRFVRPGKVLSVQKIGEGGAEAIELIVRKGAKAAEKSLRELKLPEGAIVGAVSRDGSAFLPTGDTVLEVGDDIVAFVLDDVREHVERLFAGSKMIRFESA
ncbi:MAG: Trk system potassium transporter TrkA [Planctomycetes bacterium]|nr:Trk system potassium transporter TrkA [Planctomycetota bacterium]